MFDMPRLRGTAPAQLRPGMQFPVIDRRAAQHHAQRTGPCGHHRAGVGAVPQGRLGTPATQRATGPAERGIGQSDQPCRHVIEQIVDARRGPAKALEARVAIAPHGVQRVAQAVQHHTRRTRDDEPEQRGEHRIAAVLQHRLGGGTGHALFIQLAGVSADDAGHPPTRLGQVVAPQRLGHRQRMLAQAAQAEGQIEQHDLRQPADARQQAEQPGQQRQRQHGQAPGCHPMAAPATASSTVEMPFQAVGQASEGH